MKLRKKILITIIFFFGVISITTIFLISDFGLNFLLNNIIRFTPGLSFKEVHGNWKKFAISELQYQTPKIEIKIHKTEISPKLKSLIHSLICINNLSIHNINISIKNNKENQTIKKSKNTNKTNILLKKIQLPISIRKIKIKNLNIKIKKKTISIPEIETKLEFKKNKFTIKPTYIQKILITPIHHNLVKKNQKRSKKEITNIKKIFLPLSKINIEHKKIFPLPINIDLQKIFINTLEIQNKKNIAIKYLTLKLITKKNQINLKKIFFHYGPIQFNSNGKMTLNVPQALDITSNISFKNNSIKKNKILLKINGLINKKLKILLKISGTTSAKLNGLIKIKTYKIATKKTLNISKNFSHSTFKKHCVKPLKFLNNPKKKTSIKLTQNKNKNIKLCSQNQLNLFKKKPLPNISMHIANNLSKNHSISKEQNNLKLLQKDKIQNVIKNHNLNIKIIRLKLIGNFNKKKLNIENIFKKDSDDSWKILNFQFTLGNNKLKSYGTLGKHFNFNTNIKAKNLNEIISNIGGKLKADFKLYGTLQKTQSLAKIKIKNFIWNNLKISNFYLKYKILLTKYIKGTVKLQIKNLKQNTLHIKKIALYADGNKKLHILKIKLKSHQISGKTTLIGSFNDTTKHWKEIVYHSHLNTLLGKWNLNHPIKINYFNKRKTGNITPHCWKNKNSTLWFQKISIKHKILKIHLLLKNWNLSNLKPFLKKETKFIGHVNGNLYLAYNLNKKHLNTHIIFKSIGITKIRQNMQENILITTFKTLNITGLINSLHTKLKWIVIAEKNKEINGSVEINNKNILNANMNIHNILFKKNAERDTIIINSHLYLKGSLQKPKIFGYLNFKNLNLDFNSMPLDFKITNLNMIFNGTNCSLNGYLQIEKSNIKFTGNANWISQNNWNAYISIQKKPIKITTSLTSIIKGTIEIFPNLTFSMNQNFFKCYGNIIIPKAKISVEKIPWKLPDISPDEIIFNEYFKPIHKTKKNISINTHLKIIIGNNVYFSGFGLNTHLNGILNFIDHEDKTNLNGYIHFSSGQFQAYGKNLILHKGVLQFSGQPEQPYIHLEAIRDPETTENNVTVGIRITGLIDSLKTNIFSTPKIPEEQAISYLLYGRETNDDNNTNTYTLTSILMELGIINSNKIIAKIGKIIGIKNAMLYGTGLGYNQQIKISGYLSPNLQIKYGFDIFNSAITLGLRYKLIPKLYLEIISGTNQAIDFFYQFEF